MRFRTVVPVVLVALSWGRMAHAQQIDVPEPLKPWVGWVLGDDVEGAGGTGEARCTIRFNDGDARQCRYPARLSLVVNAGGGTFESTWQVDRRESVPLPGDVKVWPQSVKVDGKDAVVVPREGLPHLKLEPGAHKVTGSFLWQSLPASLTVPEDTGLVSLTVKGQTVASPEIEDGRLWLHGRDDDAPDEAAHVELRVHRLVTDDIPLLLTTRLALDVSGKNREVVLGPVLPKGFTPMSLDSPLPLRWQPDGTLKIQASPGQWSIYLVARREGPVTELTVRDEVPEPWPGEEVWAFEARPLLRSVAVEGASAIDPQQTAMPDQWKGHPTYRMAKGEVMKLVERSRGDAEPPPDQLSLFRSWWLDFDGKGYTIQDRISGTIKRSWRLEMTSPLALGRVAVDGKDQFITRIGKDDEARAGVEIRSGAVKLEADVRAPASRALSAVGWDQDFQSVLGVLNLPPGWRVLGVRGVDKAEGTWVGSWALMDFFILLVVALAVGKLRGLTWGALAFVTLGLTLTEGDAPRLVWFGGVAALALTLLPSNGKGKRLVLPVRLVFGACVLVVALPFIRDEIRRSLYPALERPWQEVATPGQAGPQGNAAANLEYDRAKDAFKGLDADEMPAQEQAVEGEAVEEPLSDAASVQNVPASPPAPAPADDYARKSAPSSNISNFGLSKMSRQALTQYDPKVTVQTGPGLPAWSWTAVALRWSGPVERDQTVSFWLLPPWATSLLGFLRCLLIVVLTFGLFTTRDTRPPGGWGEWLKALLAKGRGARTAASAAAAGALLAALAGLAGLSAWSENAAAQAFPPQELLNQLRQRLVKAPDCLPDCAAIPRLAIEYSRDRLQLRLEVHVAQAVVAPLPGAAREWSASDVVVDGQAASSIFRDEDGTLWLKLEPGTHQVLVQGPLSDRETVQLALPLHPHRVEASGSGWILEGIHEDGQADDNLQLKRVHESESGGAAATLQAVTLPPFARLERDIVLDLAWRVTTRVVRLTPTDSAIVLRVPLLAGESVTSDGIRQEGGQVLVNMPPTASQLEWTSVLTPADAIQLKASEKGGWSEVWRLDVSPIWHFETAGIPPVRDEAATERTPTWRPWPGETLEVKVARPGGIDGQTLTIDSAVLTVTPGIRATDAELSLNMRASRGGQHTLHLPPDGELQSFQIAGKDQPLRIADGRVDVPLSPGSQAVVLRWRNKTGIGPLFRSPKVDLGVPGVNAHTQIRLAPDRWTLFVGGPRIGPAVLLWGAVLFLALLSFLVGQIPLSPLKTRHWFLLGLGLTQSSLATAAVIAAFFFLLGWRWRRIAGEAGGGPWSAFRYNLSQLVACVLAFAAISGLLAAINTGFLGQPDMAVVGNQSSEQLLRWYQDRVPGELPTAWVVSLPALVYRLAMLLWALWLAYALIKWAKWIWEAFTVQGLLIRPARKAAASAKAVPPPSGTPPSA